MLSDSTHPADRGPAAPLRGPAAALSSAVSWRAVRVPALVSILIVIRDHAEEISDSPGVRGRGKRGGLPPRVTPVGPEAGRR